MEIAVCCKQILDPEAPASGYKIDLDSPRIIAGPGIAHVVSPFDLQAVEAALRIKEKIGARVSVLSLGNNLLRDVVKKPLAMGADELYLLEDDAFESLDSWNTALALSQAIKKIGRFDLILCGRQAADRDSGQVGIGIAEFLGIPCITVAKKVEVSTNKLVVERALSRGSESVEASMPALVTVSNELGEPRLATLRGIMAATRKLPVVLKPTDIGLDAEVLKIEKTTVMRLFRQARENKCEIIHGETPAEIGANLAVALRRAKIV